LVDGLTFGGDPLTPDDPSSPEPPEIDPANIPIEIPDADPPSELPGERPIDYGARARGWPGA
jgi:hypothetical protein